MHYDLHEMDERVSNGLVDLEYYTADYDIYVLYLIFSVLEAIMVV